MQYEFWDQQYLQKYNRIFIIVVKGKYVVIIII